MVKCNAHDVLNKLEGFHLCGYDVNPSYLKSLDMKSIFGCTYGL